MKTIMYPVDLRSTHDELLALFEAAERGDVVKDGRHDRRGAAINVWSHPWTTEATRHASKLSARSMSHRLTATASARSHVIPVLTWQTCSTNSPSSRILPSGIASMA
jgi:hypothetical protein